MILAVSESPCCMKPPIKFLLKRIYSLEVMVEEFQDGCLVDIYFICEWGAFSYSESLCCRRHHTKYLLKRISG